MHQPVAQSSEIVLSLAVPSRRPQQSCAAGDQSSCTRSLTWRRGFSKTRLSAGMNASRGMVS